MELMQKSYVPLVRIRAVKERFLPYGQEALSGPGKVVNMVSGLLKDAASLVLVHNHLSGDPKPSKEDYVFTRHMKKAGTFLGIPLLDHIVVGDKSRYVSLRDEGRLE